MKLDKLIRTAILMSFRHIRIIANQQKLRYDEVFTLQH